MSICSSKEFIRFRSFDNMACITLYYLDLDYLEYGSSAPVIPRPNAIVNSIQNNSHFRKTNGGTLYSTRMWVARKVTIF